jgi:very-short-patch-repair endonuclease
MLDMGQLRRVRRGVYAGSDACVDAVAAAAHGGSLGCLSAARHLGLWLLPLPETEEDENPPLHVWLRADRHQYRHDDCGCVTHWDAGTTTDAFQLPSVERVLEQLYRCHGPEQFFVALESARRQRMLAADALDRLRAALDAAGRDLVDFSRFDADSGLESLVRLRLRSHGVTVRTQVVVYGTGKVDLVLDGWLLIEADGKENHDGESMRHKDLMRDANSASWGLSTLRFDYAMIIYDWDLVERAVLGMLATRD